MSAYRAIGAKRAELAELFKGADDLEGPEREERMLAIKTANAELSTLVTSLGLPGRRMVNPNDYENPRPEDRPGYEGIQALKSADSFRDHVGYIDPSEDVGLASWLKAYVTGDWDGMPQAVKAMSVSSQGAIVPTPTSARVIDYARNVGRVFQSGAITLPMQSSTMKVPRLLGDPTGEWKAEGAELSNESDLNFDTVTFTAKTLIAITTMSVELLEDADPSADGIVERAMGAALALELDRAALYGDASPASEPTGLSSTAGVHKIATSAGASANYGDFIEGVRLIRGDNFEPQAVIWSPDVAAVYDGLTDTTGQPLRPPASFADLLKLSTNQAASTDAFIGDWSVGLAVGMRTNLVIEASREAATSTGNAFSRLQLKIRAYLRADVQVLQPGAFAILQGIVEGS